MTSGQNSDETARQRRRICSTSLKPAHRVGYRKYILLPKQTIHTVVQELEQAGYLEKVSVSGRKEKPLRLTESGKRYTADKLGGLYRAEERAAAAMGTEQFAAMVEMTRKFTDSFEKEIRNGAE